MRATSAHNPVSPPWWAHLWAVALPILCAAPPLAEPPAARAPGLQAPPPPHAIDVWLGEHTGISVSPTWGPPGPTREAIPFPLYKKPDVAPIWQQTATPIGLAEGFIVVGSVAMLPGDDLTVSSRDAGFGLNADNMKEVSRRFIRAFGDHYDQIAVFVGFTDRLSPEALAYQMPVKNDVKGLGLSLFDATQAYGSPSGRMQSMLNMKRITVYKRDVADNPQDVLYPIWAQEAAHRWLTYFRYRLPGDDRNRDDLLGRQTAHWGRWVHAEASVLDGVSWADNGDGTFTVIEREKRFGTLDQYGMGLRDAADVPPFFTLDNFIDMAGNPVAKNELTITPGRRYHAQRTNLTVEDIVRAVGPREPASGGAAVDLRMGVVFLVPPGTPYGEQLGEAFLVDQTRAPWDNFYNQAGGGRGKVCTELLHPCRGPAFEFGTVQAQTTAATAVVAPGGDITVTVPVHNAGTEPGAATVTIAPRFGLNFPQRTITTAPLAPGQTGMATFNGQVNADAPCGYPIKIDFQATGPIGPSRGSGNAVIGLQPLVTFDFEGPTGGDGWIVDPDGNDTATEGQWEIAPPEQTTASVLNAFVVQPGGASSGTHALVTGAAAGDNESSNDVDFDRFNPMPGRTTVQSPVINLQAAHNPVLSYRAHFVAATFRHEVLVPAANDHLQVLGSADGINWIEVDRMTGLNLGWQHRLINLKEKFDGTIPAQLVLRFIAVDDPLEDNPVEAVIDDVIVHNQAPTCTTSTPPIDWPGDPAEDMMPRSGGGCGVAPFGSPDVWPCLLALVFMHARRRNRSTPSKSSSCRAPFSS